MVSQIELIYVKEHNHTNTYDKTPKYRVLEESLAQVFVAKANIVQCRIFDIGRCWPWQAVAGDVNCYLNFEMRPVRMQALVEVSFIMKINGRLSSKRCLFGSNGERTTLSPVVAATSAPFSSSFI